MPCKVALYEGSWEKYHKNDAFAADTDQSEYFFNEVLRWGDMLLNSGLQLNTRDTDKDVVNREMLTDVFSIRKTYSSVTERHLETVLYYGRCVSCLERITCRRCG